ncbi:c-type cytochrome [Sphingomonas parva]|uniref:C-type cytochrome n=1 Tax=Sphingomonas parva TaxID=2555898 RepID=A0A4Y8ZUS5_9SPHN|nr:FTR1 family protein [Sphingomonas parva]TFI59770.1 c-type cytochrome [Sphingomonas parva]
MIIIRFVRTLVLSLLLLGMFAAPAQAETAPAQTIWRLLDYIAVDYPGAVTGGRVVNEAEYVEMVEFSASVRERLGQLPPHQARAGLLRDAAALQAAISAKAEPAAIAASSRRLGRALLSAYPVPLAPSSIPDLGRGATLYAQNCASCHGAQGDGRGPAAVRMDPPPIDFTDESRARERSLFGLYQVIEQGLEGTAMPSFAHLSPEDRWALAFHVGRYAYPEGLASGGSEIFLEVGVSSKVPDLAALVAITPAQLEQAVGAEKAKAVTAYLRGHPEELSTGSAGSLTLAKERLTQALSAYEAGDRTGATDLALSAYLDGFEPVEPLLSARDASLMGEIEGAMAELRSRIDRGMPAEQVRAQVGEVRSLFTQAEAQLGPESASTSSSFVGAFTILLREGLEALLIVIAMVAFLRKAERTDVMGYVHCGWIAALVAGAATWAAATYVIGVSGASRELTEGFGSIFAAVVLLSVGIWMHGKAQAGAWQRYIAERMSHALTKRSAWFLFGLTFVVVYREVFETILFYATLWSQGNGGAVLAGAAVALVVLAMVAAAMLKYSRTLPIAKFFSYSSALIAVLAVVLAGKGVAALQEAGLIDIRPMAWIPRIGILGLSPTREAVLAQVLTLALVLFGFWYNRRSSAGQNDHAAVSS